MAPGASHLNWLTVVAARRHALAVTSASGTTPDPITSLTRRGRAALLLAVLAATSGTSIMFTVLPGIGARVGIGAAGVGALITCSGLAFALAAPYWGRLADRRGRSGVMAIGLVGYGAAAVAFSVLAQLGFSGILTGTALFVTLLVTRPIGGGLAAAVPPAAQAAMADHTTVDKRAAGMAMMGVAGTMGLVLGPAIGAVGSLAGPLVPLWVLGALGLVLGWFVRRSLPLPGGSLSTGDTATRGTAPRLSLGDTRTRPWLLAIFAVCVVIAVQNTVAGYLVLDRFHSAHGATALTGLVLGAGGAAGVVTQLVLSRTRIQPVILLGVGGVVSATGLVLYGLAPTVGLLLAANVVQNIGIGLLFPGLFAGASLAVGPHEQGALGGLVTFAQAFAFAVAPVAGGALYESAPVVLVPIGTVLLLTVAVLARPLGLRLAAAHGLSRDGGASPEAVAADVTGP
jgi:MFS family permease